jgi:serine/threonine protein kinase
MASDQNTEERLRTALVDRYAIEREIGVGGMATVYLAKDLKHERQVAVKVLDPELAQSLGAERFLREIKTAANLTHPHILPLHDFGEADGLLYYVMPFVAGESLRDWLEREGQLPLDEALEVAREELTVEKVDLHPVGLAVKGSSGSLNIGGVTLVGNTFRNLTTAFALGGHEGPER